MTLDEARAYVAAGIDGVFQDMDADDYSAGSLCLDGHFTADDLEALSLVMRADRAAVTVSDSAPAALKCSTCNDTGLIDDKEVCEACGGHSAPDTDSADDGS